MKKTLLSWYLHEPFTRGAAISYYTIFSFPALIILLMSLANLLIDEHIIQTSIISYLQRIVGKAAAVEIFQTVDRVNLQDNDTLLLILGAGMLLYASLRLFFQLQNVLNGIWEVETEGFQWKTLLIRRFYSFGVMIAIGFVLLVSLFITSLLTSLSDWLSTHVSDTVQVGFHLINIVLSFTTISILFTLLIRLLPDVHVAWGAAMRGGLLAAFLFMIGQYVLGIYFDLAEPGSVYGVSGAFILLMLWVSYSTSILLLGAELARTYALEKDNHPG